MNLQFINTTLLKVDFSKFTKEKSQFSNITSLKYAFGKFELEKLTFFTFE